MLLPELAFGVPGESTKEHAIMERGLQKLSNTTPQQNTFGPKISGVQSMTNRVKQEILQKNTQLWNVDCKN